MRNGMSPAKLTAKVYEKIGMDERDHIIRKLKEDLIIARGKMKEVSILEHYLENLIDKTKQLELEKIRSDE